MRGKILGVRKKQPNVPVGTGWTPTKKEKKKKKGHGGIHNLQTNSPPPKGGKIPNPKCLKKNKN